MRTDVFLTGGSGLVGGHLLSRLLEDGVSVRALARSDAAFDAIGGIGASAVRGDLFDGDVLRAGMAGVDVVYHVAGTNEMCSTDVGSMDRVNVDGTVEIIRAAAASDVRRVVYTSSAAAIGERKGEIGTEETEHSGEYVSAYARSKHLAEVAAFAEAERLGVDLVVVNPSSVQGPGRATGSAEILIRALNAKRPLLVDTTLSIVDIEDCTTGHIHAAERGRAGERYILSGVTMSTAEAIGLLSSAVGREIRPLWLSKGVVRSIGIPASLVASALKPSLGVCPELIRTLLHGHRFDGSKASTELQLDYTDASGTITRSVDWLREQGLV